MTNSSDPLKSPPLGTGTTAEGTKPASYARFIPREELHSFSAWAPTELSGSKSSQERREGPHDRRNPARSSSAAPPPTPDPPPPPIEEQLQSARTQGYQDGYRDGLSALEAFKQQWATQTHQQVSAVLESIQTAFAPLELVLADRIAEVAIALARQVVRAEITQNPNLIVSVAQEALNTLLTSASDIVVRLHPNDVSLITTQAAELLSNRQARVLADDHIERGGCVLESALGVIDARVEQRWIRAVEALGKTQPWHPCEDTAAPTEFTP